MKLCHSLKVTSIGFYDPNLVSSAGLVPVTGLAGQARLSALVDDWLTAPADKGANAGWKVCSLVAGMVAGSDSIDDMALLRHGGMGKVFTHCYAPSTLGSFLRQFTFGHVRQLDAVASRFLAGLNDQTNLVAVPAGGFGLVDVDDTVVAVHGYREQGAGFGYNKIRGLNALLATLSSTASAPVILTQRLRKGACSSSRGAGRLVARRIPDVNAAKNLAVGQDALFAAWRFHAFFTTTDPAVLDTVAADKTHRQHAIIEQVHADLKSSALAHPPSGVSNANATGLVCAGIAFNLSRAAAVVAGQTKAASGTTRRHIVNVAARVAISGRRIVIHLPAAWPWQAGWTALFNHVYRPPDAVLIE